MDARYGLAVLLVFAASCLGLPTGAAEVWTSQQSNPWVLRYAPDGTELGQYSTSYGCQALTMVGNEIWTGQRSNPWIMRDYMPEQKANASVVDGRDTENVLPNPSHHSRLTSLFLGGNDDTSHDDSLTEYEDQEGWNGPDHQRGRNNRLVGLTLQLEYPDHKCPHVPIGNNYKSHHELTVGPRKGPQGNHRQYRLGQIHGERPEFRPFTGSIQVGGFI